jgi:hypothetical protein
MGIVYGFPLALAIERVQFVEKKPTYIYINKSQRKLSACNHILLEAKLVLALLRVILHM